VATKPEVKKRALELLGITRVGQGAQSQDDTRIGAAYTEVYADLKKEGIATWASSGTIPDEVAPHLVSLMALNGLGSYPVSNDRYTRIVNMAGPTGNTAKREIRALVTPDYESLEEPDDF
jgi:hypothetical protein